jgi:hypothetical protein
LLKGKNLGQKFNTYFPLRGEVGRGPTYSKLALTFDRRNRGSTRSKL